MLPGGTLCIASSSLLDSPIICSPTHFECIKKYFHGTLPLCTYVRESRSAINVEKRISYSTTQEFDRYVIDRERISDKSRSHKPVLSYAIFHDIGKHTCINIRKCMRDLSGIKCNVQFFYRVGRCVLLSSHESLRRTV